MARRPKNSPVEPNPPATGEGVAPINNTKTTTSVTKEKRPMANSIIELDVNLEDFADYEILPDGPFPGECVLAEVRTSDKGNSYFYTNWKIAASDYPLDYDPANAPEGMTLNYSRLQVPTAEDRRSITAVKHAMAAMGISLKTNSIDCSSWVGKKAKLLVGHENYNGEDRNRIVGLESLNA